MKFPAVIMVNTIHRPSISFLVDGEPHVFVDPFKLLAESVNALYTYASLQSQK